MRQRGPQAGPQVGEQVRFENLLAGGVVVRAGAAPRVVVGDEDDAVLALARHGEEVVPAGGAYGPLGEPLALDHDVGRVGAAPRGVPAALVRWAHGRPRWPSGDLDRPTPELGAQPGDELLDLTLVALVAAFVGEPLAVVRSPASACCSG